MRRAEGRFRTLVEQLPLTVYVDRVDEDSSNIYSSPQVEALVGYSLEEWASDASLFTRILHPEDRERVRAARARAHVTGEPLNIEYRLVARDGSVVWVHDEARLLTDADGGNPVLQGYLLEITARKDVEEQLRHQAFHDALTELPNRALFTDRVEQALVVRAEGEGISPCSSSISTTSRPSTTPTGDELLRAVGRRLRDAVSPRHTVARIGGDEFAILVEGGSGIQGAANTAEAILGNFHEPFDVDGGEVFVTPSIGIAVGDDADELLRSANVAMYRAKTSGGAQLAAPEARAAHAGRVHPARGGDRPHRRDRPERHPPRGDGARRRPRAGRLRNRLLLAVAAAGPAGGRARAGFYFAGAARRPRFDRLIVDGRLPRLPGGGARRAEAA